MKKRTRLLEAGRRPEWTQGLVNPPVARASTCLFPDFETFLARARNPDGGLYYGRRGTPTHWALLEALCALEGGENGWLFPSGLAAITGTLLALLERGDHALITDSVYGPTRTLAMKLLPRYGVDVTFYDPLIGSGIAELMRPNTRVVMVESPGSLTFEVQDIPAIAAAAHERGAIVVADNTWATGLYCPVLALGADVSVLAATKYVVGHSDVMLGAAIARGDLARRLKADFHLMGWTVGADDAALALRGLRTLEVRLARHDEAAREIARWLAGHPEVARVLHPAMSSCPGHAIFTRDFTGASGLFAIVLKRGRFADLAALVNALTLFGLGYSWGGFESLVLPADPAPLRSATRWQAPGPLVRLHIGLEDPADLKADLEQALARYVAALDAG
ncbi:MAG: cystathionine beta-lyase [Alphaproteobacteria bacterium]|nr:MAG: cystathionine beta-lyase [Alphaproteobacteria bacterium]